METAAMEQIEIGGTGISTSRIGLGTWAIGGWMWGGTDDAQSIATIRAAVERGVTLIDTAPVYGFGRSEEIVGKALAQGGLRERVVLATKVALNWRGRQPYRDASRERIAQEIEASLRRLRTDVIDIYQVHWPDPTVPMSETAEAMYTLFHQGKIRAIGVSNFSVAQMEAFRQVAPLHVLQAPYNLFEREIDADILPYCRANGIATLGYGALCRGLLSGGMRSDSVFGGDALRQHDPKFQHPRFAQYLSAVARLDRIARQRYCKSVIHLAARWALDQGVSVALWGARRPDQLQPIGDVDGWSLDDAAKAEIDALIGDLVRNPVSADFMAPPERPRLAA
jgi:aryl-alcohol dehydrogenase-like predicted oxidoreductase